MDVSQYFRLPDLVQGPSSVSCSQAAVCESTTFPLHSSLLSQLVSVPYKPGQAGFARALMPSLPLGNLAQNLTRRCVREAIHIMLFVRTFA